MKNYELQYENINFMLMENLKNEIFPALWRILYVSMAQTDLRKNSVLWSHYNRIPL
jgi:hypothetical protein